MIYLYIDYMSGFLPDVYNIFNKYKLQMYFHTYVHGGTLPTKICWKAIVDEAIDEHEQLCIIDNLQCKNYVDRYLRVYKGKEHIFYTVQNHHHHSTMT